MPDPLPDLPPLYILRHGQTRWNVEGRMQGRKDSALTDLGRAQAAAQRDLLAPILAQHADIACFSSPLGRAATTAQIALAGRKVRLDPRIAEVSVGPWEGRLRAEVLAEGLPALAGARVRPSASESAMFDLFLSAPEGEGFEATKARCKDFLAALQQPAVIVSHGVISAVLRGLACGLSRAGMARLAHHQGCVVEIIAGRERLIQGSVT
ncbi:Putative phosphoserine phosphatase 2 [Aquimixticola soesokkakensis]|uniref:Putative phosphoserine phosphatase 2 n=1 Tax=Aquimixticola soesokkakensis TaxID=1519096 RepID=A0A1Y5SMV9_9RHOB|nr:histidine phosphatase family protein [Aquimixticola soesokkakensis]SLN44362.1 Putative phosphoserine phosphatase 2 [Aquimixticola soesokkakensis]